MADVWRKLYQVVVEVENKQLRILKKFAPLGLEHVQVGVNDLPLSLVLSWYEQKAVAILLSLLFLGIKKNRIGLSLPAFGTLNILEVLAEKFSIMPRTTPSEDLKAIMK
jgi:hydroxylamine reductase